MPTAIIILGQPGSGKSTLISEVAKRLEERTGLSFLNLDNERTWTAAARNQKAKDEDYESADDPEFRKKFGLEILKAIMAENADDLNKNPEAIGLIHLPDKNPDSVINGTPVLELTMQQYKDLGIEISDYVVLTFEGSDKDFADEFRRRFGQRGQNNPEQEKLDADKRSDENLLFRRHCCNKAAKQYIGTNIPLDVSQEQAIELIVDAVETCLKKQGLVYQTPLEKLWDAMRGNMGYRH
jgi:adenylate kinase family enzyme